MCVCVCVCVCVRAQIQCGEFGSQVPDDRNKMTDAEV